MQVPVHQHNLVLHALARHVQQLLQPLHLPPPQRKYTSLLWCKQMMFGHCMSIDFPLNFLK